jgi:hypothetical protein
LDAHAVENGRKVQLLALIAEALSAVPRRPEPTHFVHVAGKDIGGPLARGIHRSLCADQPRCVMG